MTTKRKKKSINVKINLQLSLTKNQLQILEYTKEKLDDVQEVKFIHADIHGNLKVVPNPSPVQYKSVFDFQCESDIVDCYCSCPVVMKIMRIYMMINALCYCHIYWRDYCHH